MKYRYSYIIRIQYLGFRFHGWQKQQGLKTVHDLVDKTLSFVFEHFDYKTIGVGRTDAKVSAKNYPFQLFINQDIELPEFIDLFNKNSPNDIKGLSIKECKTSFAIINSAKIKTYHYYFSFGEKQDAFSAPLLVNYIEELDIELMKKGAKLFEGEHFFHKYCAKPKPNAIFKRTINKCEIVKNQELQANFIKANSFILIVKGEGFMRYQIRFIMAVLIELGKNKIDLPFIKNSISENNDKKHFEFVAPSSGLQLFDVEFL